jgi:septum formation protein
MDNERRIRLASSSPRRKELLENIGLRFEVDGSGFNEEICREPDSHKLAIELSLRKVTAIAGKYQDAVIIGADTFGVLDGQIIGKPRSLVEARTMLARLSGRHHFVITGFTVTDTATAKTLSAAVETKVYIKKLTSAEIDAYVKTREPLDKAGAYAIQGLGALIVEKIEGDYFNVVGLPIYALANTLREFGIRLF